MSGGTIQERPKPPSVDQIKQDIESAQRDDVVFIFGTPGVSRDSTPVASLENSFEMTNHPTDNTDPGSHGDSGKLNDMPDISSMYLKTLQLLNTTEVLKSSSENLQEQYDQLEKLGQEVKDAITELESAAQTVKPQSMKPKTVKPKKR